MSLFSFFLSLTVPVFVIRICVRSSGRIFLSALVSYLQFLQFRFCGASVRALALPWIVGIFAVLALKARVRVACKPVTDRQVMEILDALVLTMSKGHSLSAAFKEVFHSHPQLNAALPSDDLTLDFGIIKNQSKIFNECMNQLRRAAKNPSFGLETISSMRETMRLRLKLHAKQDAITTQAKAQGAITLMLYLAIFASQLAWNPDFMTFLQHMSGRICLLISVFLLMGGVLALRWMSKPKEFQL